ncbi:MAG TPA: TonB-dependent receptor plug domain-containing protein, partial [Solimonas sp.]|nr:TonB-dependent receptor plug domain-containing protein [Solimonas sp.]
MPQLRYADRTLDGGRPVFAMLFACLAAWPLAGLAQAGTDATPTSTSDVDELLGWDAEAPADPAPSAPLPVIEVPQRAATPAPPPPTPPKNSLRIEEIVVTAQKTSQLIEDVPISLSVVDQKFIADWGLTDVREVMLFVPNVKVEEAGFFASPRVRGFSFNNNNKAFEPPAGIALDGIPYTRVEYFNAALFDVQRIEALRGPQGTTFGKNTTAGLIHIISANPTDEFAGYAQVQGGELERRRIEAAVSGPLVDGVVNFRLAGLWDEREGFIDNTTAALASKAAEHLRSQQRSGFRAKLHFPELAGSDLKLSFESVEMVSGGAGAELFNASERIQAVLRRYDPNVDFIKNNYTASIDQPDGREVQIDSFVSEWNTSFGEWDWTALGGHSVMENQLDVDTDFSPAPAIFGHDSDRSPTSTLELRAVSPSFEGLLGLEQLFGANLGSSDLLIGAFYQHREIQGSGFRFRIGTLPFLELTVAGTQDEPAETLLGLLPPALVNQLFSAIPSLPAGSDTAYEEVQQGFDQEADAIAGFGQLQWHFMPQWVFQAGLRYSQEDKSARWNSA